MTICRDHLPWPATVASHSGQPQWPTALASHSGQPPWLAVAGGPWLAHPLVRGWSRSLQFLLERLLPMLLLLAQWLSVWPPLARLSPRQSSQHDFCSCAGLFSAASAVAVPAVSSSLPGLPPFSLWRASSRRQRAAPLSDLRPGAWHPAAPAPAASPACCRSSPTSGLHPSSSLPSLAGRASKRRLSAPKEGRRPLLQPTPSRLPLTRELGLRR